MKVIINHLKQRKEKNIAQITVKTGNQMIAQKQIQDKIAQFNGVDNLGQKDIDSTFTIIRFIGSNKELMNLLNWLNAPTI